MHEEDVKERQENEVEAIKAIYWEDVADLRASEKDAPYFSLRILPQRGSSGGQNNQQFSPTSVLLVVKFPTDYPNVVPELVISECKGLSSQEVSELKTELEKLAAKSVGEVMILNLAQCAERYLYMHQKTPTGSFYDEMLLRKKQLQEQTTQKQLEHIEKERLAIQEEIQRKQDALKEELRRRKEEQKAQNENISPPQSYQSSPVRGDGFPQNIMSLTRHKKRRSISLRSRQRSTSEGSDSSISEYSDMITLDFSTQKTNRKFQRGELLGQSARGSKVYAGMDCTSGSLVAIAEWNFSIGKKDKKGRIVKENGGGEGNGISYDSVMKQMSAFESEFNLLQKLEHPNIVLYLGIKVVSDEPGIIALYIASEFIRGTTLQSYLQDMLTLDCGLVRHCALGILQALHYLHSNNVVHRCLRDTSVFMDMSGEIKITDYGLERKITELYQSTMGNPDAVLDVFPPSIGRGAKKGDIYRFGVLILSLLKGQHVVENPPEIPASLPPELQDFLRRCLTTNEHSRLSAAELLEHTFLKMQLQKAPICYRENGSDVNLEKEKEDEQAELDKSLFSLPLCKGVSRVQNEFEVIEWLGKGGFGDVLKVRNKLDGGIYALKQIKLNPKNKLLNKKITREVKLLSQLNHENVVRYYNSWIETVIDCVSEESSSFTTGPTPSIPTPSNAMKQGHSVRFKLDNENHNSLGLSDNIEQLAPPAQGQDSEWSISMNQMDANDTYDSDESSEEEDIFGTSFLRLANEESDDIIFESNSSSYNRPCSDFKDENFDESSKNNKNVMWQNNKPDTDSGEKGPCIMTEFQFMYIQMEFCEKSTLRTAIDDGLWKDRERVWRLFREVVEGLVHIHQQGMIHRDLKPVNIFLDSNDHVKIGDFGLATTSILNKSTGGDTIVSEIKAEVHQSMDFGEESMTGMIGTALYVAPELMMTTGTKAFYNQKVDIYSLGIILFEMIYHPLDTAMERVRVIAGLRQKDITFPADFDHQLYSSGAYIVKWVLNHDPSKRPTSLELLQSDYMPPPQIEEAELYDMFRRTLANPQSKMYKYLVASCFKQNVKVADDITYNLGMTLGVKSASSEILDHAEQYHAMLTSCSVMQKVKKVIQNVFERHGAVELNTPLLTPKSDMYEHHKASVHLMSHSGKMVTIPFDLRVPFARYVVWNKISSFKRYSIGKVFRENKVFGLHPSELYECAMDVVSPSKGSLIVDAELISVIFEVIGEIPWVKDKSFTIRLSHTFLLDAVFMHYGIDEKSSVEVKQILAGVKTDKNPKSQVQTRLVSLCLPEVFMSMVVNLMEIEGPLSKVQSIFKGILRKKDSPAAKVKEAFHELEVLISHIEAFGMKCDVVVSPSMVFGTSVYTGLLFQVVCNLKKHSRKKENLQTVDVIAVGGRYDALIEKFRSELRKPTKEVSQSAVGISISLDKLAAGLEEEERDKFGASRTVDVIICSLGHHPMWKEKINIMKTFMAHGVQCYLLDGSQTLESAEEQCKILGAPFIVILKETEDVRVRSWEKDRFQERRLSSQEAVELILRSRRASLEANEMFGFGNINLIKGEGLNSRGVGGQSSDSNEKATSAPATSSTNMLNISFVVQEKDKLANWKRRYENQMLSHITDILPKLSKQQVIEILGVDVNSNVLKTISAFLQIQDKEEYRKSVSEVIEKHAQPRLKKYLSSICDEIYTLCFEKEKCASVIIIYSINDNSFRVLM